MPSADAYLAGSVKLAFTESVMHEIVLRVRSGFAAPIT